MIHHRLLPVAATAFAVLLCFPTTSSAAAPTNSTLPTITGFARVGQTLTCTSGTWSDSPTAYEYQWSRAGTQISDATASTHLVGSADTQRLIQCSVTALNADGSSAPANSAAIMVFAKTKLTLKETTRQWGARACGTSRRRACRDNIGADVHLKGSAFPKPLSVPTRDVELVFYKHQGNSWKRKLTKYATTSSTDSTFTLVASKRKFTLGLWRVRASVPAVDATGVTGATSSYRYFLKI